ncbi:PERQ amino acid-rich with GYF domain-containing protein, putative [Ixodes scapularis]|uniref:PERQ amino acid-rich with GYF domain-containing protein, putative n=1 Tax=Ixodes scapularis TaxID=6945 RepID=B7QJF6_IXOSC|nr:PERQ amino acid-rich with GYF domain-containing protein, putative [Ixodes scapularis]|eukprot:XP_002415313.1 PERQ amino acid-rich with GYF domain-containing protein, putative [Ixodes scapularis]
MGETALKFGPEWLRALTQTNGVTAPAPTAGLTKYKLSNYRYGREEMLAMFDQSAPMPETLREFQQLAVENTQPPLALVTMTEEEQRIWARSVNSDAVLRLTVGKGAVPGAGPGRGGPRGGSVDRGRGRGRGGVYQRGLGGSSEESGDTSQFGAFIRARPFERSHSLTERDQRWDDKKPDRQFPARPGFDGDTFRKEGAAAASGAPGGGAGATSATTSRPAENWRSGHSEEDENWRSKVSSAQPPTEKWKSWRNHAKGDEDDGTTAATNGPAKKDRHWIEDHGSVPPEQLPEWIQDQGDTEKVGSFDAKGAFLDTREFEEESWEGDLLPPAQAEARPPAKREDKPTREAALAKRVSEPPAEKPKSPPPQRTHQVPPRKADKSPVRSPPKPIPPAQPQCPLEGPQPKSRPEEASKTVSTSPKDDSFAHLAKAAENMMAEWTAEEEKKFVSQSVAGEQNLPEHLYRWLYKDPQGDIQGPFSSPEMMEWFQAGYFTMDLMVKRVCDMGFSKLGALIKSWGVVPFAASQQPAPMKSPLGLASLPPNQVTYAFQQHYMQEVYRAAAMQQIQNHLKTNDAFANLSPIDQNRICLQYYMASHPMSRPAGFGDHAPVVNLLSSMGLPPVYGIPHSLAKDSSLPEGPSWPPQPVSTAAPTKEEAEKKRQQEEEEERRRREEEERQRREEEERRRMEEEEERRRRQKEEELLRQQRIEEEKRKAAAAAAAAAKAASAMAAAPPTGAFTAMASSPAAKKSPSKVSLMDADEFMALKQPPKQQPARVEPESSVLQLSGAWGTTSNSLLKSFNNSFQYLDMVQDEDNTRGFWDEAVTTTPAPKPAPKSTSKPAAGDGSFPSLAGNPVAGASSGRSSKSQQSKKAEEQVMKLFEVHAKAAPTDELTAWCVQVLGGIQSYLDIPTVVAILKDVESPAEVQEYVHNFFGNSLDTKDFVQQFLQRRERYLKSCGSVPRPEDTFTLAASSIASMAAREASATTQGDGFTAARSKKKKKSKMQKVDSSLLGFTVQADPARLNAGEIDRVEGI